MATLEAGIEQGAPHPKQTRRPLMVRLYAVIATIQSLSLWELPSEISKVTVKLIKTLPKVQMPYHYFKFRTASKKLLRRLGSCPGMPFLHVRLSIDTPEVEYLCDWELSWPPFCSSNLSNGQSQP